MPTENEAKPQRVFKAKSVVREYIEAFVVAVVLALFIRTFVVQAFKIPSGSMLQTLQIGDHILVNKFIYCFSEPERGDIIVFKFPKDPERDFIKRIIGLPGETIEIKRQVVYINGKLLDEPYINHEQRIREGNYIIPRDNFGPLYIPPRTYFTMGDNRDSSMDSRYWGPLKENMIKGEAFIAYWSIKPTENTDNLSIVKQFINYIVTLADRIRWERIGKLIH